MSPESTDISLNRRDAWIVAMLLIAAALLRIPGLERVPPGLWFDEGLNGCDALEILRGGPWKMVFTGVFPREPGLIYPMVLLIRLFGAETFSLRLASALVGTAAPALLYLWLRRAASFKAALFAALFLVAFRWHLHFSRIALRTIWTPTLACAFFAALWKAFDSGKRRWEAVAGAVLGLGVYSYLAWYFFLPVALVAAALGFYRTRGKGWGKSLAVLAVAAAVVATPMMIHYAKSPSDATGRVAEVSPFKFGLGSALPELMKNAGFAAKMLFWRGDHVPKQNIPWKPALEPIGLALFVMGLWSVLRSLRRSTLSLTLLLYLIFAAQPTVFSKTDSANFLRTLIMTPAVAAIVGLGAAGLSDFLGRRRKLGRGLSVAIPSLMLAASMLTMLGLYFITWAHLPGLKYTDFCGEQDDMARYVRSVGHGQPIYVFQEMAKESYTFRYLADGVPNVHPYSPSLEFLHSPAAAPGIVLMYDPRVAEQVKKYFPHSSNIHEFLASDKEGQSFVWAQAWQLER